MIPIDSHNIDRVAEYCAKHVGDRKCYIKHHIAGEGWVLSYDEFGKWGLTIDEHPHIETIVALKYPYNGPRTLHCTMRIDL